MTRPHRLIVRRSDDWCCLHKNILGGCDCRAMDRLTPDERKQVQIDWLDAWLDEKSRARWKGAA
jgi:hypothetical protein